MKLISMTDFVLAHKHKNGFKSELERLEYYYFIYKNYATFLKQPLTLGMFVPCDENGNVLHEPKAEDYFNTKVPTNELTKEDADGLNRHYADLLMFEEAKEKVLFEDFIIVKSDVETLNHTTFMQNSKGEQFGYNKSWEESWNLYGVIIEDLIGFEIELTESALKQIGLNP